MIKKTTSATKTKPSTILFVIFLGCVIGFGIYELWTVNFANQESSEAQSSFEPTPLTPVETQDESSEEEPISKTPTKYEGEDANKMSTITGFINYKGTVDDILKIRVTIDQFFESTGTCDLILSSGDKTYTKTVKTLDNPSSATCDGFDVPVSELAPGTWSISISIIADGKSGIITGEVTL